MYLEGAFSITETSEEPENGQDRQVGIGEDPYPIWPVWDNTRTVSRTKIKFPRLNWKGKNPNTLSLSFMGKSLPPTASLQEFARIIASSNHRPKRIKPISGPQFAPSPEPYKRRWVRVESEQQLRFNKKTMEEGRRPQQQQEGQQQNNRLPLAAVVSDCVKRWFQDTLKEAKAGDGAMQILVGQMYHNGYGVCRDDHKVPISLFNL